MKYWTLFFALLFNTIYMSLLGVASWNDTSLNKFLGSVPSNNFDSSFIDNIMHADKKTLDTTARDLAHDQEKLNRLIDYISSYTSMHKVNTQKLKNKNYSSKYWEKVYRHELLKKKISLCVRDAMLSDVLELIAATCDINIVIDPTIVGRVKFFSVHNVTLGIVLRSLLSTVAPPLGLHIDNTLVHVIPCEKIQTYYNRDESRKRIIPKQVAASFVMQHAPWNETFKMQVRAFWDHSITRRSSRAYLVFHDDSRTLFFRGGLKSIVSFKNFLKTIDRALPKVLIKARIVIADKHFEQNFGIQWNGMYDKKSTLQDQTKPSTVLNNPRAIGRIGQWSCNLLPISSSPTSQLSLPAVFRLGAHVVDLLLNAAEHNNEIKTILKPTLLANDGHVAQILQGEVIPIDTIVQEHVGSSQRQIRTARYRDVGIQLRVKPTITPDKSAVRLELFVENSLIAHKTAAPCKTKQKHCYPTIITTRTKTTISLRSEQTTMISGLIKNSKTNQMRKVPFLSRIPFIGWLFKNKQTTHSDLQLLIFITPIVIND